GEFTEINEYVVRDLKARGLWDDVMVADLKYFDGSLAKIDRIPQDLRDIYATAFEVDPSWLVEAASRRQKWIDQAQSLNIYMAGASGKRLDETYKLAWLRGLKTTYYLRTIGATHTEKSTSRAGALNAVAVDGGAGAMASAPAVPAAPIASAAAASAAYVMPTPGASIEADGPVCTMRPGDAGFEECEACQ
ncbi:ribonucleoside-diphosphate reductase subunit alpha, partial [Herbaspirillum huttiense]